MLIDLKEHRELVYGAAQILKDEADGSIRFQRQTDAMHKVFQYDGGALWDYMADCPAGVRIAFQTDALKFRLKLQYGKPWGTPLYTGDTDVVIDHDYSAFRTFRAEPLSMEEPEKNLHEFTCELEENESGTHQVEIFLCNQVPLKILEFEVESENMPESVTYNPTKNILFIGDSITQGYFSTPAGCYAARYANHYKADFHNVAIGGAVFREYGDAAMAYPWNDLIICFGTNDCGWRSLEEYRAAATATLDAVTKREHAHITLLSSVPFPATKYDGDNTRTERLQQMRDCLKDLAAQYKIRYVDGTTLVPDDEKYFVDNCHPNDEGMALYGKNFIEAMESWHA